MAFDLSASLINSGGITVSNATELKAAIGNASPGDVIVLAGGNYGDFRIADAWMYNVPDNISLVAADTNNPPIFNTLTLDGVTGVTLSGLSVHMPAAMDSKNHDAAIRMQNVADITLDNMTLKGSDAINGISATSPVGTANPDGTITGLPFGNGVVVNGGTNVTIQNSDISNFYSGIRVSSVDGYKVLDNEIYDLRTTPIAGADVDNVVISGNYAHDSRAWNLGGAGDHGDFIHLWTEHNQGNASRNITISDNTFEQGSGSAILGIYLEDNYNFGYDGVTITDNVIWNGDHQGMRLERVKNAQINNNTLLDSDPSQGGSPGIYILASSSGVTVNKNIVGNITVYDDSKAGVTLGQNLYVQRDFPERANYYDDLFANSLALYPTGDDLMALPGSIIDTQNFGAAATQPNSTPSSPIGFIADTAGTDLAMLTHQLDASMLYGPSGLIDPSQVQHVAWNYGDGQTGTGLVSTHAYSKAGLYDVTAQITLTNGTKLTVNKSINVETPVPLNVDFNSGFTNGMSISGNATIVHDGGSNAVDLNGGNIAFDKNNALLDNQAYTVLVDFRKSSLNDNGVLLDFPGSLSIQINGTNIQASVRTTKGTDWMQLQNVAIDDTKWHQIALTFSSISGAARLYVDGVEVGTVTGLTGENQTGHASHNFYLGSAYSQGFTGLVDNLSFVKGELTANEVLALSTGAETLSSVVGNHLNNPSFQLAQTITTVTTPTSPTNTSGTTNTGTNDDTNPVVTTNPSTGTNDDTSDTEIGASTNTPTPTSGGSGGSKSDTSGTLTADTANLAFSNVMHSDKTAVKLGESKSIDSSFITGLNDDDVLLQGGDDKTFHIDVLANSAQSGFANSLGVYEYDAQGRITDVRVIDVNTQNSEGTIVINDVEAGNSLGFFIIQDGYNRLDQNILNSNNLSLKVAADGWSLMDGSTKVTNKIFVSHNSDANFDGSEHIIAGISADDSNTMLIGFEDQARGNNSSDNDFQDVLFTVSATDSDSMTFV